MEKKEEEKGIEWVPKTRTGRMVLNGEITTLEQIYSRNLPLLEPEIVDMLVPDLKEEVLDIKTVQRTTDSGRKMRFLATVVVGNKDGYVGVGIGKGANVRPAIERATRNAKLNIIHIQRGCGSWECGCGTPHSVPYKVEGKSGSVRVILIPAPKGTGIVAGKKAKKVLELAGIKDVWSKTFGDPRTTFNFAMATLDALRNIRRMKIEKPTEVTEHEASSSN
ncbi:MAG: 30S ribosomal protein S5 [Candidatus Diapherotrites archaeon]|nr:30S ribosomal protein S5 [Candidatus Diapherotrites archaeon]